MNRLAAEVLPRIDDGECTDPAGDRRELIPVGASQPQYLLESPGGQVGQAVAAVQSVVRVEVLLAISRAQVRIGVALVGEPGGEVLGFEVIPIKALSRQLGRKLVRAFVHFPPPRPCTLSSELLGVCSLLVCGNSESERVAG